MTLARLAARRGRLRLAAARPALRPLPLVHRRPDARAHRAPATARAWRAAALLLVRPARLPARAAAPRAAGTSATSAPTATTASPCSTRCCSSRRGGGRGAASSSPVRSIPDTIAWPGNVERIEHLAPAEHRALLQRPALHAERHARRHGAGGLVAERAAVRGGGLRHADHQRRLGGTRLGVRASAARSWSRARPRTCSRSWRSCPRPSARPSAGAPATRVLAAHTAAHRAAELEAYARELIGRPSREGGPPDGSPRGAQP